MPRRTKYQLNKEWQAKQLKKGHCVTCGKPNPRKGRRECSNCADKNTIRCRDRKHRYIKEGRCRICGNEATVASKTRSDCIDNIPRLCHDCWFRRMANTLLGDTCRWREIQDLFFDQSGRCAYTGEILILGQNTSLDHRIPKSRGGTNDLSNLQ